MRRFELDKQSRDPQEHLNLAQQRLDMERGKVIDPHLPGETQKEIFVREVGRVLDDVWEARPSTAEGERKARWEAHNVQSYGLTHTKPQVVAILHDHFRLEYPEALKAALHEESPTLTVLEPPPISTHRPPVETIVVHEEGLPPGYIDKIRALKFRRDSNKFALSEMLLPTTNMQRLSFQQLAAAFHPDLPPYEQRKRTRKTLEDLRADLESKTGTFIIEVPREDGEIELYASIYPSPSSVEDDFAKRFQGALNPNTVPHAWLVEKDKERAFGTFERFVRKKSKKK